MLRRLQRIEQWSWEQIDASPSQFKKTLPLMEMNDVTNLAVHAGKRMAEQLAKSGNVVKKLDAKQIDEWRRKYGVPRNRTNVMLMVAWSTLHHPKLRCSIGHSPRVRRIGMASPRTTAKKMIEHYGFRAEKIARKLQKGSRKNRKHWSQVLVAMRTLRMKVKLAPTVNLARRGAGQYCSYLARQQRILHSYKATNNLKPNYCMPSTKRLVSRKLASSPTLCIAIDDMFHARCNRPVAMGGSVFCDVCQPGKERS